MLFKAVVHTMYISRIGSIFGESGVQSVKEEIRIFPFCGDFNRDHREICYSTGGVMAGISITIGPDAISYISYFLPLLLTMKYLPGDFYLRDFSQSVCHLEPGSFTLIS